MKTKYTFLLIGSLLFLITSCIKDTCNGELGNTFESIEKEGEELDLSGDLTISFATTTLADLPSTYFEQVMLFDSTTEAQTQSIDVTKTSIAIVIPASELPTMEEIKVFQLNYVFDDRRNHIDCQHPGSSDQYFLEMNFSLVQLSEDNYSLMDFNWNEIFAAGHL